MADVLNKEPLISICIPTFNRSEKVFGLVSDILKFKGNEIEVVVLDNCSTDNTEQLLLEISDTRFSFIKNEENIGGPLNHLKAITVAKGKYAFFCLDKDYVQHGSIQNLINKVTENKDIVFGHCALNCEAAGVDVVYEQGFPSVLNMSYLSQHPTGLFYRVNDYRNLKLLEQIFEKREKFGFYPDILNAEMAMIGKSLFINCPAFFTESTDECAAVPSFTYSEKDVFFAPSKRLLEFEVYLKNAINLGLSKPDLARLIRKLYNQEIIASTFGYRKIMADESVCIHYGMQTRLVRYNELVKLHFAFSNWFSEKKLPIGPFDKFIISFCGHVKFSVKSVLLFIK